MELIKKSIQLDLDILRIKRLTVAERIGFVLRKYMALVSLKLSGQAHMAIRQISFTAKDISALGSFQSSIVDFYSDIAAANILGKDNPVILDVGANVGQFCNAAKLFFPEATIYSFEPDPSVFEQLRNNTAHLKNVTIFNNGLSDHDEKLSFYVHELSGMSSFKQYPDVEYDQAHVKQLEVKRLDDMLPADLKIDLLKVDVEGFELKVLSGSKQTISRSEFLLIEVGLAREQAEETNLGLFSAIRTGSPLARIVKIGRPLGDPIAPTCQDVLIKLG
jgi:FkbM family methyltransferase